MNLHKFSLTVASLFLALQIGSYSTLAEPLNGARDSSTTTFRTLDADGVPVMVTSGDAEAGTAYQPPAGSVDIGQAGRQYVQQQQRESANSGRMTETFGFGIGLVTLLAVGIIAYAIHPNKGVG